jgi:hypothetical protein
MIRDALPRGTQVGSLAQPNLNARQLESLTVILAREN